MIHNKEIDIDALIERDDLILDAIRRGGLEAMKRHIQAGVPMVSWKDGGVVHIQPEELKKILAEAEAENETEFFQRRTT